MRLQRALARSGVASRRASEELIRAGRVRVNGEAVTLGAVVDAERDRITVDRRVVRPVSEAWMVLHKPVGVVVSRRDPEGRAVVYDLLPEVPGLTYVGRLDVMTEGLLLFGTDGALVHRLTHPRYEVLREYRLVTRVADPNRVRDMLAGGVIIDGRRAAIRRYRVTRRGAHLDIRLTLVEGRHRIVRRVAERLDLRVERLVRLSHGPIRLGKLPASRWRYLTADERRALHRLAKPAGT